MTVSPSLKPRLSQYQLTLPLYLLISTATLLFQALTTTHLDNAATASKNDMCSAPPTFIHPPLSGNCPLLIFISSTTFSLCRS